MRFFALIFGLALVCPAWAEELEHFPGWKINKIEKAEEDDGSYNSGPDYYGLTPPDDRPTISIDGRTAKLLKAGEAQAEDVYNRLSAKKGGASAESGDEQYVYSAGNNGFVQADTISSTLPGYALESSAGSRFASGGRGFSAGSIAEGGDYSEGSEYSSRSSAGALASAGSFAGSGSSAVHSADPFAGRFAASGSHGASSGGGHLSSSFQNSAGNSGSASALNGAKSPQLASSSQTGTGLGGAKSGVESIGSSVGTGAAKTPTDSKTVVATRKVASTTEEKAPPPPCTKGRFVYDKPTLVRIKLPEGCDLVHISAWGAGGGSARQVQRSGGRESSDTVREIPGGGASFMSTSWEIDAAKYDLVVVVGEAGTSAKEKVTQIKDEGKVRTVITVTPGAGGYPEGKDPGGSSVNTSAGGGGGGYSGVFLTAKGGSSTAINKSRAMAVGAGGAGGNGGAGGSVTVPSSSPDARMTNQIGEKGKGTQAGFHYYFERGNAGSPGMNGKVVVEYY